MLKYNWLNSSGILRTLVLLTIGCFSSFPTITDAQITKNAFVGATVRNGLITFFKGDPDNKEHLSFTETSYLTVEVNDKFYSNNPYGGIVAPSTDHPIDFVLANDLTSKIVDTIQTVWKESGFDIVQKVYPVAFTNSGVIVLSISVVNHSGTPLSTQAEYLIDNENDNTTGGPPSANDNPVIFEDNNTIKNWEDFPPNPLPSFYLAFESMQNSPNPGTVGIGYTSDSSTQRPIGLLPLLFLEFGDWPVQINFTFGLPPNSNRSGIGDEATLMIGQPIQANGGSADSMTEIIRTAYGTPPASLLNSSVSSQSTEGINGLVAFPNPLNSSTSIRYSLASQSSVTIKIFDGLGREVASPVIGAEQEGGDHTATFDARDLAPGVYTCRLLAGDKEQTAKMVVAR